MKFNLFQKFGFLPYRRLNLRFWNNTKKWFVLLLFFIVIISLIFIPKGVYAGAGEWAVDTAAQAFVSAIGTIILWVVFLIGQLIGVIIWAMVEIVQYNDFISSPAVSKGWIIIRDLFNMFFVVILLVIAFSAVLKIERYPYKRMLSAFLIAAILVNFSKLISGILIDFSQILMLTFVNAFKDVAGASFVEMLGLKEILALGGNVAGEEMGEARKLGTYVLALIFSIVSLVVMLAVTLVFAFRIVGLWFLVVLSPLAFMAMVLPSTQSYGRQWWQKFTNYLIVGPVLAFFIWLSLAVIQEPSPIIPLLNDPPNIEVGLAEAGEPQFMLNFIIGIAMLIGSLMVAKQLGVAGAGIAVKAIEKMQAIATGAVKLPFKGLKFVGKEAVKGTEARLGIPLTGTKFKEMWQERRRQVDIKRRERFEEKREGVVIPRGSELIEYMSLKGIVNLPKVMTQRIFGIAEKRREKANQIEDNIEKIGIIKQTDESFTPEDRTEVEDQLKDLEAVIGTLSIDDGARQELLKGLDLTGVDLEDEEQRQAMADKVWNTGSKIKRLRDDEKIDRAEAETPLEQIQNSFSRLAKREISDDEMKKLTKEQEKMKEQVLDLRGSAEMIQPTIMTPEQREALNRGVYEEYQKIKPIDDMDELMAIYRRAEKRGRTALAKAVLTKLSEDINLNELQESLGIEQSWKGMAGLADRLAEKFKMPKQEAYTFMNDIGAANKKRGHFQFMMPFMKDQRTGLLRKVTEEEYNHVNNVESGKVKPEVLFTGSWAGIFRKHKDSVTGERVPIYDETVGEKFQRGLESFDYLSQRGRITPEIVKNFSHPEVMDELKKIGQDLTGTDRKKFDSNIAWLEGQQKKHWGKVEEVAGAPLRREEKPTGPDTKQQEIARNILDAAKANKDIAKLIEKKSPEQALLLQPVAQAAAQHGNIREMARMHRIHRTAFLKGMGNLLGGFAADLKDIDFLKDITLDPKIDIDAQAISQLAKGMKPEIVIKLHEDEKSRPLAQEIVIEMVNQAKDKDEKIGTNEASNRILAITDLSWAKELTKRQKGKKRKRK